LLFCKDVVKTFSGEALRKLRALSLCALGILVWAVLFAGCSGNGSLSITLTPASGQTLNPGQTVTITAAVANDTNSQGVTWSLTGPGSLSGNTTTSVVFTAPANVSTTTTATITATSVANSTITATESITVNAVLTITTGSLPAGILLVPYNAFVNASGATPPLTWTVVSGSLPAGLTFLSTSTSTSAQITGTPTVLQTSSFTVQVSDTSGATVTQALSITINKPPPLSVATGSLLSGTVGAAYSQTLQASSGVPPYTWSLTAGTLPVGLALASNGVISGTPAATGTSEFTVQVVDSTKPAAQIASANLSITINPGNTNNSKLSGNYAFSVRGFDPNGLFVAAGSFVADGNGNIASGLMDTNDTATLLLSQSFSGTYSVGQNGLGTMTFNMALGGSRTFAFSVMANSSANMIEFDDSTGGGTRNSGVLMRQTTSAFSTAQITGSYAFGFLGVDSGQNRFGLAGDFQADGTGKFTSGLLDSDDAISGPSANVAFTGAYSVASTGRGTATITTGQGTTSYAFYVVNAAELLVVGIDPFVSGGNPLVSGMILGQTSNSSFSLPSVFELTALDASQSVVEAQVGQFNAISGGFSLTSDQNKGGALTSPAGSGGYTIVNGRVSLSPGTTGSGFQNTTPTSQPVFYMVNDNEAFIIGADPEVSFGFMAQQSGPFTDSSLAGTYAGGSLAPVNPDVSNVVSITVAGSNNLTVTSDISSKNGLSQNQASGGVPSVATNGRVAVAENGNPSAEILYMVTSAQFFAMSGSGDTTARVDIFQH
jgi:hypothetical protein